MPRPSLIGLLFLSSYTPMFVLIGVRSWDDSPEVTRGCAVLSGLGIIGLALFLFFAQKHAELPVRVTQVERRDADVAAYAATYLLPFMTVFTGEAADVLSLLGFIAVLGVVYVRSRLIYVNPLLTLIGYDLYRVTTTGKTTSSKQRASVGWPKYLLVRRAKVAPNDVIVVRESTADLLVYERHEPDSDIEPIFDPDA